MRIQPGNKSRAIKDNFFITILSGRMGFAALSYLEGNSSETTNVLVNEVPFAVRASLLAALRQLCHRGEDKYEKLEKR